MKAVLEGTCKVCDRHIGIGDSIDKTPEGWWVHTECADLILSIDSLGKEIK